MIDDGGGGEFVGGADERHLVARADQGVPARADQHVAVWRHHGDRRERTVQLAQRRRMRRGGAGGEKPHPGQRHLLHALAHADLDDRRRGQPRDVEDRHAGRPDRTADRRVGELRDHPHLRAQPPG